MSESKFGRELDAQVARALGWTDIASLRTHGGDRHGYPPNYRGDFPLRLPHYSTDIEGAWCAVELMHRAGWSLDLHLMRTCVHAVFYRENPDPEAAEGEQWLRFTETVAPVDTPLAISLAVLLALEKWDV